MNHLLPNLEGYHLMLASRSPRRRALLEELGLKVSVLDPVETDESFPPGLDGADTARFIALQKAKANNGMINSNDLVITADTIVFKEGKVLGKPKDRADAIAMLKHLSGGTHQVYTAVCLNSLKHARCFVARTDVTFSLLSEAEIIWYVDTYQPYDKAGAYGVQEWIGFVAVERIEGSYYNVMGLPIHQLYVHLKAFPAL
jgi:septum formation protein